MWLDGRDRGKDAPGTSAVYIAKSTDKGATFGRNVRVAGGVCPCCRPAIAFGPKGEVSVAWRHVFPGSLRDIVLATSTDGGQTFSPPVRVAEDNWRINGCPHSGPALAFKGDRLFVAWYSDGASAPEGVRIATTKDGQAFSMPVQASGEVLDANHPQLDLALDGRLLLTFQGRERGDGGAWNRLKPWVVEIGPDGKPGPLSAVPGTAKSVSYPAIAGGSEGTVFAAWTEPVEKGRQVFLSRGRKQ